MKIKVSKKDVIWNYAGVIASLGSNLLMLPIVLYFLTGAQVGLWYVFQSMASLSTMFDFGFTPTFSRNSKRQPEKHRWNSGSGEKRQPPALRNRTGSAAFFVLRKRNAIC